MYQNNTPGKNNLNVNTYGTNSYSTNNSSTNQQYYQSSTTQEGNLGLPFPSNRPSHASMIIPQSSLTPQNRPAGGFGKLQSMGRVIKQQPDPVIKVNEAPASQTLTVPNTLSFRSSNQRPKMSSSVIFPKSEENNFSFQPSNTTQGFGTSRLQGLMGKGKNLDIKQSQSQTPQQKRKRQIGSIKQQLNKLNKKMEHFSFKKPQNKDDNNQNKQYFQLPTRKVSAMQSNASQEQGNPYLAGFKKYSDNNNSNTGNTIPSYVPQTYQTPSKSSQSGGFLNVKQENTQLQHSLSANQLQGQAVRKEEPGGLFKKKMNQFQLQPQNNTQPQKTFLLSPKNQPPKIPSPKNAQYKPAQIVQPSKPKMVKRVDSIVHEAEIPQYQQRSEVSQKQFKRSDFIVGKKLGKGQFGQVMMVIHKKTGFLCAMKVMSKKQIRQQKYENQVARELSIQFYLEHRNVSPLYGYFTDEENMYLLVEYATGGQLLQTLRKAHRMEQSDCSPIIREVCEGLDYVHKEQIIHRDIKPENILFNFDTVKICDFGWAVHCGTGMRKTVAGSPLYYSPQVVKQTKYDQKIDIWAIGMMTYECILGKIPFRIYSQLDLNRIVEDEIKFPEYVDVTDEVKDFILRICKKDPDERMEMRDILRHPFITKYLKQRKVGPQILEELHKFLSQ